MKADGKKYRVGYYRANPGLVIRAYWLDDPSSFTQWEKGVDFTLHFTKNQFIHVTNTAKKKSVDQGAGFLPIPYHDSIKIRSDE